LAGEIAVQGFGARYKPLEQRADELENEIPRLQAELDLRRVSLLAADDIVSQARDLYGRWSELEPDEKRHIVESIVDKIQVGKDEIAIHLCYLPPSTLPQDVAEGQHGRRDSSPQPA